MTYPLESLKVRSRTGRETSRRQGRFSFSGLSKEGPGELGSSAGRSACGADHAPFPDLEQSDRPVGEIASSRSSEVGSSQASQRFTK